MLAVRPGIVLIVSELSFTLCRHNGNNNNEKSAQRRRKHCTLAVVRPSQKFTPYAPLQTPFPGGTVRPKLSAGDGHYLYLQTQFGGDQCTQFRVIVVTDPYCPSAADRTNYNTLCRSLACSVITRISLTSAHAPAMAADVTKLR